MGFQEEEGGEFRQERTKSVGFTEEVALELNFEK